MKLLRKYQTGISLFLAVLFSIYASGCNVYKWSTLPGEKVISYTDKPLNIYLLGGSGADQRIWKMNAPAIDGQTLKGSIQLLPRNMHTSIRAIKGSKVERLSEYRMLLYLNPEYAASLPDSLNGAIQLDKVDKMELYEYDLGTSIAVSVMAGIGIAVLIGLIVILIAFATKGSCPFVYADTPDGRFLEGELYSGATQPQLERHDWLHLRRLQAIEGQYRIVLANRAKEIQHTNLLELEVVDHPAGTIVQYDKYGRLHTLAHPQAPLSARGVEGQDILPLIAGEDSLLFTGTPNNQTRKAEEAVYLEFKRPAGARHAKLLVHAKNSFWMDYANGLMFDELGVYVEKARERYSQKSAAELREHMLRQNMPLSVYLETRAGTWERVDYFNLAGPIALKRDVLPIDLSKVQGDVVRIKLGYGYLFWEIDQVALDFSADQPVQVQRLAPASAIAQDGADVTAELRSDDERYYDQPNTGDQAIVLFPAPAPQPGMERSLLLHAKGHYRILREPTDRNPGLRYTRQFAKPDAFPMFARDRWRALSGRKEMTGH